MTGAEPPAVAVRRTVISCVIIPTGRWNRNGPGAELGWLGRSGGPGEGEEVGDGEEAGRTALPAGGAEVERAEPGVADDGAGVHPASCDPEPDGIATGGVETGATATDEVAAGATEARATEADGVEAADGGPPAADGCTTRATKAGGTAAFGVEAGGVASRGTEAVGTEAVGTEAEGVPAVPGRAAGAVELIRPAADDGSGAGRGAASRARSCLFTIGPAAVTSSMRRMFATVETRFSTMPPGVQVCSSGTRRTARGSVRGGSWMSSRRATEPPSADRPVAEGSAESVAEEAESPLEDGLSDSSADSVGVHQRGGRS
ncbi:MAG: hypothetical protein QOE89_630 [Pseudonocardiales bacterium]|nr:hypothetical protein [Pseudonocardiales bacterium]